MYEQAPQDILRPLVEAITERRLCRITYSSPRRQGQTTTFDILPLKVFVHHNAPYVMAQILKYNTTGSLNLQRLSALDVLAQRGEAPANFDPKLLEDAAFGVWVDGSPTTFELHFDAEIAPYIRERRWHPSQTLADDNHGGVRLSFSCHASVEVEAWVASWRHHVTVIAPQELRSTLARSASTLLRRYLPNGP